MKKLRIAMLILMMIVSIFNIATANNSQSAEKVYVIPVRGQVGPAMDAFVSQSIQRARTEGATSIIFDIDTLGGRVDSAESISNSILNAGVKTIAYVNKNAQSAGVLITISADQIAMAPGSSIGSASTIPETEKNMSHWRGRLTSVANQKGRDPELVVSMAEKDIEIEGIVASGKLLALDYKKAKEIGFADLIAKDIFEILKHNSISNADINYVEENFRLRFARYATDIRFSSLLLTIAIVATITEVFTAGFGVAGTLGFVAFALYFGGSLLAGAAGWGVILIFITGIVLLLIEAAAPGFGVPGIGGILCIFASIILSAPQLSTGILSLVIALFFSIILLTLIFKFAPKSKTFDRIVLHTKESKEMGYIGTEKRDKYMGLEGTTLTPLRPAGSADFGGERVDVVSEGAFIDKGTLVKVVKIEGIRVIVRAKE